MFTGSHKQSHSLKSEKRIEHVQIMHLQLQALYLYLFKNYVTQVIFQSKHIKVSKECYLL